MTLAGLIGQLIAAGFSETDQDSDGNLHDD